jgi:hypothetical protein
MVAQRTAFAKTRPNPRNYLYMCTPRYVLSRCDSVDSRIATSLWCPKLESRGTNLEKFLYRSIRIHHTKLGCFVRLTVRATCCTRNIFKKLSCLRFLRNRHFYLFWGGFVWGLYGGGLTIKCQSFVRDLSFWPARRTPRQFSQKAQGTDQLLYALWTAGFTLRPPDIGSVWCILIFQRVFQVSNRTIVCILKRSARLCGDCMEPNHMAKYSLPVLTDLTENLIGKKQLFIY